MPSGPVLIFDKSTLQSLNIDEAVWLDHFFTCNITPLFFVETLADLEKEVRRGRSPEEIVGNLAYKTPDMGSRPNIHHKNLLSVELIFSETIDMRFGRPVISGGRTIILEGKTGTVFRQSPEQEAFQRWIRRDFLPIEREQAKSWRRDLAMDDYDNICQALKKLLEGREKPKSLSEAKSVAEAIIDLIDRESMFRWALALLGVTPSFIDQIVVRWHETGSPHIRDFSPYFVHVLTVDLFFYLAVIAGLISRDRRSNRVDIAYLYYLPFCMVFTSNDRLHINTVPLFLQKHQSFVEGSNLKKELRKLDDYYSALPEEVKKHGILALAPHPPINDEFLVTRLWDKSMQASWRDRSTGQTQQETSGERETLLRIIKQMKSEAAYVDSTHSGSSDDLDFLMLQQKVYARKGKWIRFLPQSDKAY